MNAHRAQGVDLLGDFHCPDFSGHRSSNATGQHDAGERGAEFSEHPHTDECATHGFHFHAAELEKSLGCKNRTDKGAGDNNDWLGFEADFYDLVDEKVPAFFPKTIIQIDA